jgi:hypothetical protein
VITGNGGPGVTVLSGSGHTIRGNSIYGNAGLAIDLGDVTANDTRDIDGGPNGLQNAPVVTAADEIGLSVSGTLESRPFTTYAIEVYGSVLCPSEGAADLETLLGTGTVTTDVDGLAEFTIDTAPYVGELSATATSMEGSTSESSDCFTAIVTGVDPGADDPRLSLRAYPNPCSGPTTLSLSLPRSGEVTASIHDVAGRRVRALFSGRLAAGPHHLDWDGADERGRRLGSGVYFYRLRYENEQLEGRIVTVR